MMKNNFEIFLLVIVTFFISCNNNIERDKVVNKKTLLYGDYRIFQNTPAWELAKAVEDGNIYEIKQIVSKDTSLLNFQEAKFGATLLMMTVINQQWKSFNELLNLGADVNLHDTYDGSSALIKACYRKNYDIKFAKQLIKAGANVNDVEVGERREGNKTRMTPLIIASKSGNVEIVKLLLANGANVNFMNEYHRTALTESVILKRYDVVLLLLENGADYKIPMFYRPTEDPGKDQPIFIVDYLREDLVELGSREFKKKMAIVDFLKSKGVDYRNSPIPSFILNEIKKMYPKSWEKYSVVY
ncbi:ankyrin repeat protein [Chitinophaga skermanii]|uniref:Ankyrin repeat protein n=1 Tax=Chitinophaga skermanii TaxID=331697 RepID=A0A327QQ32_9BACT|nr:ankyrin repeat domain-containing protein [Chitinophaga skermanii]RAJ06726.1 ankyrin repeat protein [Chitinophaga skermanii]